MSMMPSIIKGGAALSAANAATQVLRLARIAIVARFVVPEDFAIAYVLGMSAALVQIISDFGVERLMVQTPDGDDEQLGGAMQTFLILRGLLMGLAVLALAPLIAAWFEMSEAIWTLQVMALVPVLHGLGHRDLWRVQRQLRFGPMAVTTFGPSLLATIAALPLAMWCGDYRVFLWLALLECAARTVTSHVLADRRFRLGWHPQAFWRIFDFGWPLVLNGLLLFAILQCDRIIIGRVLSKAELGLYHAAFNMTLMASMLVAAVATQLSLPVLSQVQSDRARFQRRLRKLTLWLGLTASLMCLLFTFLGPVFVRLLLGEKYLSAAHLVGWLGIMQAIRLLRVAPDQAMMALGDTRGPTLVVAVRTIGVPLAVVVAWLQLPLHYYAIAGAVADLMALAASMVLARKRHGLTATAGGQANAFAAVWIGLSLTAIAISAVPTRGPAATCMGAVLTACAGVAFVLLFTNPPRAQRTPGKAFRSTTSVPR